MIERFRFRLLWFVLLFVAQYARESSNELLTSKPVGMRWATSSAA
jgi:hypothetical protein